MVARRLHRASTAAWPQRRRDSLPEIPYDLDGSARRSATATAWAATSRSWWWPRARSRKAGQESLRARRFRGRSDASAGSPAGGVRDPAAHGQETRRDLGQLQRGGMPTGYDRCSPRGSARRRAGDRGEEVGAHGGDAEPAHRLVPIRDVLACEKRVNPSHDTVQTARAGASARRLTSALCARTGPRVSPPDGFVPVAGQAFSAAQVALL